MSKGIYTKENVGNGVFIFTVNKNFVEPKFWGLHEENEQAQCVVIIHDGNALFFYPEDMDYDQVKSLRIEAVQKLKLYRPVSIGQASRIAGVSPADVSVLLVYLESHRA